MSIETQNCLCEKQALFFSKTFFRDDTEVIFAKFGFHIRTSWISFVVHGILSFHSRDLGIRSPNYEMFPI